MKDKKAINFNYVLVQIKTDQFAIFEDNFKENEKIDLVTSSNFGLDIDKRIFVSILKFTFEILEKPFITIQTSCYYQIDEADWNKLNVEDKIIIPKGFASQTAMHCVGTARGILHTKTEDTIFNKFILPPINVENLVTDDLNFDK
jgi:hypothetical protein